MSTNYFIRERETTKLFYNKYLYKLLLYNPLVSIFRDKNFTYARQQLDALQLKYESGEKLRINEHRLSVPIEEFVGAKFLLAELDSQSDVKLRIESPRMSIYSNDKKWLEYMKTKPLKFFEFWSPNNKYVHLLQKNTILTNDINFGFTYKVTFSDKIDPNFYKWIINNPSKVRVGDTCLESIKTGQYVRGFYVYIKDDKILSLIMLMIGSQIARIDNIVYKAVKDK